MYTMFQSKKKKNFLCIRAKVACQKNLIDFNLPDIRLVKEMK